MNQTHSNNRSRGNDRRQQPMGREVAKTQIEGQLENLFNRARSGDHILPPLEQYVQEGVDHINVHRNSTVHLGYLLSTQARLNFELYGLKFSSIANLMCYYRFHCMNEDIRTAELDPLNVYVNSNVRKFPPIANLYVVVCLGYMALFRSNPELLNALSMNDLPLDSYTESGGARTRHPSTRILIKAVREAHQSLVFERWPNLLTFVVKDQRSEMARVSRQNKVRFEEMFAPEVIRADYYAWQAKKEFPNGHPLASNVRTIQVVKKDTSMDLGDVHVMPQKATAGEEASEQARDFGELDSHLYGDSTEPEAG